MSILIASLALAAAAPTTAQATANASPETNVTVQAQRREEAAQRRVCRSLSTVGTRMRQRQCMTQAQWDQHDEENRERAGQTQDDATRNINQDAWYGPVPN